MDETRRNTIGATVFAVLTGLSALFFTAWAFTTPGCHSKNRIDTSLIATSMAGGDAVDEEEGDRSDPEGSGRRKSASLDSDLDAANAEIQAGAVRRTELAAENSRLQAELKAMKLKFGDVDVEGLRGRVSSLQATTGELKGKVDASTGRIGELEAELENLKGIKADLDAQKKASLELENKLAAANKTGADWKLKFENAGKVETDLKKQIADLGAKANAAGMAQSEAGKLRARITDLEQKLNDIGKERLALKSNANAMSAKGDALKKLQGQFDNLKAKADADAKKLAELGKAKADAEKKLADSQKAMAANAGEAAKKLQADLEAAKKKATDAESKLAAAEKKLADSQKAMAANAGEAAKKMKADLDAANKKAADAEKKLADAQKNMAAKGDEAAKKLKSELDALKKKATEDGKAWETAKSKLEGSNNQLRQQLAAMKKQLADKANAMAGAGGVAAANALAPAGDGLPNLELPLLVNDPAKLNPDLRDLFGKLRGIDDTPTAREKLYADLKAAGKTDPSLKVSFSSGSDYISNAERGKIKSAVDQGAGDAKYLVVGYASTDGSEETNYRLSSQRASNVAKRIADQIGSEDRVQAVYFGDTKRFSASRLSPNRVVEVWRIK